MGFPRQEYWKWVVISSSGSSGPGVEPVVYRQIICHWAPGKPRCWGNGNRKSVVLPCRTVESSCGGRRRHTFVVEVDGYWRRGGKGSGILFPPQARGPPCVCSLLSKVTGMCKSLDNTSLISQYWVKELGAEGRLCWDQNVCAKMLFRKMLLEYIYLTVLCYFLQYSSVSQFYVCTHPLFFWVSFPVRSPQNIA